jgi:flagellar basal-body rod protein FlgB
MMEKSLGFLWTKQAAIMDNISNAETPNYKTKVVTFEETLKDQLEKATKLSSGTSTTKSAVRNVLENSQVKVTEQQVSTRMDENGVNVTEQSTEMIRNAYQLQYLMKAMNTDLSVLRTAIQA